MLAELDGVLGDLFVGRVAVELVLDSRVGQAFVLLLQALAYRLQRLVLARKVGRVDPAFRASAWVSLDYVWRFKAKSKTDG